MNFSSRLKTFVGGLKSSYGLDKHEKAFIQDNIPKWPDRSEKENIILVQMPRDYGYLIKFGFFANYFAEKHNARLLGYTNWISAQVKGRNFKSTITNTLLHNSYTDSKWLKLYNSFGIKFGFSNSQPAGSDIETESLKIFNSLQSPADVYNITVRDIPCGDLIYDTYLRFRPDVTLDIKCPFLLAVIKSAFEIYETCTEFLNKFNVKCLLNCYCSYLHHGIVMRVCLKHGVDAYTFAHLNHIIIKTEEDFPCHYRRFFDYRKKFAELDKKEEKLTEGREFIENRFKGRVDSTIFYLKESAFSEVKKDSQRAMPETGKKNVLLLLHCFFDNPNTYRFMLFNDFWDWVVSTLDVLRETEFAVYVKAHPNAIPQNVEVVDRLKQMYPDITFVDPKISNKKFIAEGLAAAITMKGTCGHEFPYFGVPVLNAGDNPHVAFSFCVTPESKEDYIDHLKKIDELSFPEEEERLRQIYEFSYMHNIYQDKGRIEEQDIFGMDSHYHIQHKSEYLTHFLSSGPNYQGIMKLVKKAGDSCEG